MTSVPSTIPTIANHVLEQIEKRINGTKVKQHEELLSLHSVFGVTLQRALEILEKYPIFVAYTTVKKTRTLIEVKGENDRRYRVFPRINYCPCRAFKHQVLERKSQICCKHVLVVRIAQILGKIAIHEVTQDQYLMLLSSMFDLED